MENKGTTESYRNRLQNKSIKELKAIYVRMHGIDLLRGKKSEMINILAMSLNSRKIWECISI